MCCFCADKYSGIINVTTIVGEAYSISAYVRCHANSPIIKALEIFASSWTVASKNNFAV